MRYDVLLFWTCAALSAWLFTEETTATTTKCWMRKLPGVGGQNPTLWKTNIDWIDCVCLCVNQAHSCDAIKYDVKARSCYSDRGKKLSPLQFVNRYVKTCSSTCYDDFELVGNYWPPSCIPLGTYPDASACKRECLKDAKCLAFIFFNFHSTYGCCRPSSMDVSFSQKTGADLYVRRTCLGLNLDVTCAAPTTTTTALVRTTSTKSTTTLVHSRPSSGPPPGPCLSNPCEVGRGTCIDEWQSETHATYRCQCHSQYTGEFCQYEPVGTKFTVTVITFMCLPASVFVVICCFCLGKGAKYYCSKLARRIRNRNPPAAPDPAPAAQPAAGGQVLPAGQ